MRIKPVYICTAGIFLGVASGISCDIQLMGTSAALAISGGLLFFTGIGAAILEGPV